MLPSLPPSPSPHPPLPALPAPHLSGLLTERRYIEYDMKLLFTTWQGLTMELVYEKSSMVWLTSQCWFWSQTIVTVGQLSGFLPKSYYRVRSLLILISSSKQLFRSSGHFSGHKYLHHGWPANVHHQCHRHKEGQLKYILNWKWKSWLNQAGIYTPIDSG